jgi:hypothetical protein
LGFQPEQTGLAAARSAVWLTRLTPHGADQSGELERRKGLTERGAVFEDCFQP